MATPIDCRRPPRLAQDIVVSTAAGYRDAVDCRARTIRSVLVEVSQPEVWAKARLTIKYYPQGGEPQELVSNVPMQALKSLSDYYTGQSQIMSLALAALSVDANGGAAADAFLSPREFGLFPLGSVILDGDDHLTLQVEVITAFDADESMQLYWDETDEDVVHRAFRYDFTTAATITLKNVLAWGAYRAGATEANGVPSLTSSTLTFGVREGNAQPVEVMPHRMALLAAASLPVEVLLPLDLVLCHAPDQLAAPVCDIDTLVLEKSGSASADWGILSMVALLNQPAHAAVRSATAVQRQVAKAEQRPTFQKAAAYAGLNVGIKGLRELGGKFGAGALKFLRK